MDGKPPTKTRFKATDGRYTLLSERTSGLIPFQGGRATRLTLATLRGGAEAGRYVIFNVSEQLLVCAHDATNKDPLRSLVFNPASVRDGYPRVHAFSESRDGNDLLVGLANGEVHLLSLRAQLQLPPGSTKPSAAATLNEGGAHDGTRCCAVLWAPRSAGAQFLAVHYSGNILVYKKSGSMLGEGGGSGKLLSMPSLTASRASGLSPCQTITVPGSCGANDAAFSPDGGRLAVACRDGSVRLLDWPSGQCVAGYRSYYGAALCCCWSPDGRLVASGGEDDLVAVYSVPDRRVVAFGEGHSSYVSRVAFDAWGCGGGGGVGGGGADAGGMGGAAAAAATERTYRLGSCGQDTALCLWDLVIEEDAAYFNQATGQAGIKRVASSSHVPIPKVSSGLNLATMAEQLELQQQQQQQQQPGQQQQEQEQQQHPNQQQQIQQQQQQLNSHHSHLQQQQQHHHHNHNPQLPPLHPPSPQRPPPASPSPHGAAAPAPAASPAPAARPGTPPPEGLPRQGSSNLLALLGKHPGHAVAGNGPVAAPNPIGASLPRAEMTLIPPVMQHKLHAEPLSDVLFCEDALYTACHGGQVKRWGRPAARAGSGLGGGGGGGGGGA
ncbi:hypothetical protein Rsub_01514 [Raphidocelis subcapitata]|uniref:Uncharacterized protein n=1 Tax=Raphidocelis subcapitata TaxID=307507 RepID=A0A2V0NW23_9CHLO|nr:hypothetical protein Rsub_01514 [Raphidocelis subcapitata]|eukprot:GBF89015.1 hypothetical protein Rsub_01514 [Raphidocelis subcapitata]